MADPSRLPRPTEPKSNRKRDRVFAWPVWLQVLGFILVCFGVGALAGAAWALITGGVGAIVVGGANDL